MRAFIDAALHQSADLFELRTRVDRADVGVFIQRIAHPQSPDAIPEFANDGRINSFLHKKTRAGAADMALIEINAGDDAFNGLIEGRVFENNVRGFAAQFERQLLGRAGGQLGDLFADFGRTGERQFINLRMLNECGPGLACAGDDVDHSRRQLGFLENSGQLQCGNAGGLGGLENDGVAASKGGSDFPRRHQQWEIPGNDLARDAERFGFAARKGIVQLVRPAGMIKEMRCH